MTRQSIRNRQQHGKFYLTVQKIVNSIALANEKTIQRNGVVNKKVDKNQIVEVEMVQLKKSSEIEVDGVNDENNVQFLRENEEAKEDQPDAEIFPDQRLYFPFFLVLMSAIEFSFYVYQAMHLHSEHCFDITAYGPFPECSYMVYNPSRRYEVWRLLSYVLVHSGYVHILSNLLVQMIIGLSLEVIHGPLRIGTIYLGGALVGSLFTTISDPLSYLAGASGGAYAILGAHTPSLILNWKSLSITEYLISGAVFFIGLIDLGFSIYRRYFSDEISNIGYAAHIGGAVGGFLIGINVLRNFHVEKWENYLRLSSFITLTVFTCIAILINAFASSMYFPTDKSPIGDCDYDNCS